MLNRSDHPLEKLRNAALALNNFGIIADISRFPADHNVLHQLLQEQDMLSPNPNSFGNASAYEGQLEAANAPHLVGQLEWEEDRRPDAIPYTPKQRHGRFTGRPVFPSRLSKGQDALSRRCDVTGSRRRVWGARWTRGKLRNRPYVLLLMSLDRACAMS